MSSRRDRGLGTTLHARVQHLATTHPERTAVVSGTDALTYGELDERANRFAWRLRELGVARGTLVGVGVDRSVDMVVGLLAILKAGGAYVPLAPGFPVERLRATLSDAGARALVTQSALAATLRTGDLESAFSTLLDPAGDWASGAWVRSAPCRR